MATMTPGDAGKKGDDGSFFWRPMGMLLILCGLVALLTLPDFNPGSVRGSWFGLIIMTSWGAGLLIWALGMVRRSGLQFRLRTLALSVAALAIAFGACPWLPTLFSLQIAFVAMSGTMVYDAWQSRPRSGQPPLAYQGNLSRIVLNLGGLLGLALVIRNLPELIGLPN